MSDYRMESEEEALFRSYQYAVYFVQSPSSNISSSHANTNTATITHNNVHYVDSLSLSLNQETDVPPLALSRYSSSRGSNSSSHFNHNKKQLSLQITHNSHNNNKDAPDCELAGEMDGDDHDDDYAYQKNRGWIKYFSFSYSNSGCWILMQLSWRFLLSLMIALLVFYVAAKPPHPNVSVKVAGIPQFRLGEGVDGSGVTTKILSCNFSINVIIDNDSKLFALHVHPPIIRLIFGRLTFAISQMQRREVYAGSDDLTMLRFNVGTKNKAMYGAGRNMQDFLESERGLPLVIKVSLQSTFHVIWGIFQSKYHHEAQCLVVVDDSYDKIHRTQVYNSTCVIN